uniref:hypothetical protein n=1 Tax=Candidatus Fimenecus sp. TaxID=3022888 RepID=UPI003FF10034
MERTLTGSIALIAEPRLSLLRLLSRAHRLTEHRRISGMGRAHRLTEHRRILEMDRAHRLTEHRKILEMDRILTARPYICRHAKSDSARR